MTDSRREEGGNQVTIGASVGGLKDVESEHHHVGHAASLLAPQRSRQVIDFPFSQQNDFVMHT